MINVFRMELYRVMRSVSTWVMIVIYFGLYLFAGGVMGMLTGNSEIAVDFQRQLFGIESSLEEMQGSAGITLELDAQEASAISEQMMGVSDFAEMFNMCMMGNMVVLILSVFIGIHGTGHVVTGFQKNLAGSTKKWHFVVSNLLICTLFNAVLIVLGMLALRLVMLFTHDTVTMSSMSDFLRYCGTYLLLSTAYGMFGAAIADLTRNRVASIAVPVIYCTVASSLLYQIVNIFINTTLGFENFAVEEYLPYGCLYNLMFNDPTERFVKAVISAAAVILICMAVSIWGKRKQDIR